MSKTQDVTKLYPVYLKPEIQQLTDLGKTQVALVITECNRMVEGKDLEYVWEWLGYTQGQYLALREECQEKGLVNLFRYLGRRYNMIINVPSDFERFKGRVYDRILG